MGYESYSLIELIEMERDYAGHRKTLQWVEFETDKGLTASTARSNLRTIDNTLSDIRHQIRIKTNGQ